MLTVSRYLDLSIGNLQSRPTCRSTGSCEYALMLLLRTLYFLTDRPFRLQPWTRFSMQEYHSLGQRLVAPVKGSVSLAHQFNLSEDIIPIGKAYLGCGTRVVREVSATC